MEDIAGEPEPNCLRLVKQFLSLLNSSPNSVLPGSAMSVTQSWLSQHNGTAPLVTALLRQVMMIMVIMMMVMMMMVMIMVKN